MTKNQRIALWITGGILIAAAGYTTVLSPVGIVGLLPIAFLLVPLVLSIRQMVRPVPEPAVSWQRAVLVPGLVGLVVGGVAGLIFKTIDEMHCPGEWGCLGQIFLAVITVPPGSAIVSALILRTARTPRPWLTAILGVIATGFITTSVAQLVSASPVLFIAAGLAGYVWAAMVLGPLVPPVARIVIYCLMILLLPVTNAADSVQRDRERVHSLERLSVPLLVPDVPGYHVTNAYADNKANRLSISLHPADDSHTRTITVEEIAVPSGFAPPENCGQNSYQLADPAFPVPRWVISYGGGKGTTS